jgi:hypothetical protein
MLVKRIPPPLASRFCDYFLKSKNIAIEGIRTYRSPAATTPILCILFLGGEAAHSHYSLVADLN